MRAVLDEGWKIPLLGNKSLIDRVWQAMAKRKVEVSSEAHNDSLRIEGLERKATLGITAALISNRCL